MSEWMNVIAKRELNEDDIIKIKFLSRKSKAAKKEREERERRLEQMKQTQAAQNQKTVANVPSMVNLNEQLAAPELPAPSGNMPKGTGKILADPNKEKEQMKPIQEKTQRAATKAKREQRKKEMEQRQKNAEQARLQREKQQQQKYTSGEIAEGAKMATQMQEQQKVPLPKNTQQQNKKNIAAQAEKLIQEGIELAKVGDTENSTYRLNQVKQLLQAFKA